MTNPDRALTNPDEQGSAFDIVFEGSHSACAEAALVLEAKSIPYELEPSGASWVLKTAPPCSRCARDELARYAVERRSPRPQAPTVVAFPGAGLGTAA
ncbi:MAG TPA: hypothetical protein VGL87_01810, partial [Steroidobacteraceae bacterium]